MTVELLHHVHQALLNICVRFTRKDDNNSDVAPKATSFVRKSQECFFSHVVKSASFLPQ